MSNLHGSAVAFAGRGVLILGGAGTGKSALALALIGRGAALVADDRVEIERRGGALIASAPAALAGLIEVVEVPEPHEGPERVEGPDGEYPREGQGPEELRCGPAGRFRGSFHGLSG